jgi:hypothetical protein
MNKSINKTLNLISGTTAVIYLLSLLSLTSCGSSFASNQQRRTEVTIVDEQFHINGVPTYEGRMWTTSYGGQYSVEGLLMNARLVQGVFDDLNPQTSGQWIYPDTKKWDPDRNTREFVRAMPAWKEHGMLAFTLNLQGGCPYGYCNDQPWDNSAFTSKGALRTGFMDRLEIIIDRADELGMVVMLGYFYFGQDENLEDEEAVKFAVQNATRWVLERGYTNVIIEINNECNVRYDHDILKCDRVDELIDLAKSISVNGRNLYVSTSLGGGGVPPANIVRSSDFIFLHGNGVSDPQRMFRMIRDVRQMEDYRPMPIVNNEDDQPWRTAEQGWGEDGNNFTECVKNYASWGYFDFRFENEHNDYNQGFQSIPVNWQISSERKRDFFNLMAQITGSPGTPVIEAIFPGETGKVSVDIQHVRQDAQIEQIMLIINNEVVSTIKSTPLEFNIEDIPDGEHWVKVRAVYRSGTNEVIIESPYYHNPWWPYGGPPRKNN